MEPTLLPYPRDLFGQVPAQAEPLPPSRFADERGSAEYAAHVQHFLDRVTPSELAELGV